MFWDQFWAQTKKRNVYALSIEDALAFRDWLVSTPTKHGRDRSAHTVNDALRNMAVILNYVRQKHDISNPFSGKVVSRVSTPRRRPRYLTKGECNKLLGDAEEIGRDIHLVIALGIYAGLRKSEMLSLRWDDIHFGRESDTGEVVGCMYVWSSETFSTKTERSQRVIPLHTELKRLLEHYRPLHGNSSSFIIKPSIKSQGNKRYRWEFRRLLGVASKEIGYSVWS
tara:strand:+ start:1398 stop:2072 length:675 start_codon:yes stop_codon:yes gene_type:complete